MDLLKDFFPLKCFNPYSFFVVIGSLVLGIILLGVVADVETNEERYSFTCRIKGEEKQYFQATCFADYQAETTKGFPLYTSVLLYFLLVAMVSLLYSLSVKSRIEYLESQDPELIIQPNQSARLYCRYCIQLAIRFTLGMTFLILQWGVFYPLNFPAKYSCDLSRIHQVKPLNTTSSEGNVTHFLYDCLNQQAGKKTSCIIVIFVVILLFTFLTFVELIYVMIKARVCENFKEDLDFFKMHLKNKIMDVDNFTEEMTDANNISVDNFTEEIADTDSIVKDFITQMKETIKERTKSYEPLLPNIPGEERKLLELDKIYTKLIVYPGRAEYEFSGRRHEIVEGYLKSQERHKSINNLEEIFAPRLGNPQDVPLSVMIIGRPGIGKSLLCLKILRDWASGRMFNKETETGKHFEYVCLFKFRHFNIDEKMNLQELLGKGQFSEAFSKEVYEWIRRHPEKILLIFDGLDEFGKRENIVREEEFGSKDTEKIPFSALYSKLTLGKLLKGATVVTTSRPTALSYVSFLYPNKPFDRSLEVLGFDYRKIKEYVERFCQDSNVYGKQIWDHISSNGNLLSLCYTPVTCHILCFSFQEKLKQDEGNDVRCLPTTLTEIYEDALMVILCKHNSKYRGNVQKQKELLSSCDFAFLQTLGKVAYEGIEDDRLIFESSDVKGHEECGLLHQLKDKKVGTFQHKEQYCFLHLTIQEFLAAKYIVAQLRRDGFKDLQSWISDHMLKDRWEVGIQFVAGLLNDEENSKTIFIESLPRLPIGQANWPRHGQKWLALQCLKCIFEISRNSNKARQTELVRKKLSGVVNVDLSWDSITDADLTSIVFVLQEVESIASLNIKRNSITSFGCLELAKMLGSFDAHHSNECKLTTLDISNNNIGADGLKHLSNALSKDECKLTTLDISYNNIGTDGLKHLSNALSTNECKLTTLDISCNNIGADRLKQLSNALSTNECKLTTLDISRNKIGADGLKHLSNALSTNECKLTTLDISDNNIGADRLKQLSDAISTSQCKLTTLDISHNNIGADGLKHLSDAISTSECQLTSLDISWNELWMNGSKHLSDALSKSQCKLTKLSISDIDLTSDKAKNKLILKNLSDALTSDECKVTMLTLQGEYVHADLLKHLSGALSSNKCKLTTLNIIGYHVDADLLKHLPGELSTLNIRTSIIGDDAVKSLCNALSSNKCKVETLNIRTHSTGDRGLKQLYDAASLNGCKLTKLNIDDSEISDDVTEFLSDAVSSNECKRTTLNIAAFVHIGQLL